jgi:hypothetical protein
LKEVLLIDAQRNIEMTHAMQARLAASTKMVEK